MRAGIVVQQQTGAISGKVNILETVVVTGKPVRFPL